MFGIGKAKIVAGDFDKTEWMFSAAGSQLMISAASTAQHLVKGERHLLAIDRVEQLNDEKIKSIPGTAGWGIAGAALLGPLGAIGGMLVGGNKQRVTFAVYTKDGKKFMAVGEPKAYQAAVAATM